MPPVVGPVFGDVAGGEDNGTVAMKLPKPKGKEQVSTIPLQIIIRGENGLVGKLLWVEPIRKAVLLKQLHLDTTFCPVLKPGIWLVPHVTPNDQDLRGMLAFR